MFNTTAKHPVFLVWKASTSPGHLEVTQALLEAGADKHLCVQNKQGVNAFFMAVIQDTWGCLSRDAGDSSFEL